ncbi:nipped-B-like protein, partial [Lampetra planeri]
MNGDMPHVPITTLAGITSLTDLLNELPLPSPLPATTNKSLLFSPRVAEDAARLLSCREDALVAQLCHALAQVSTEHIEVKESVGGSEEPDGDVPALLQSVLARSPSVFKEKSLQSRYGVQTLAPRTPMVASPYVQPSNSRMHSPNILQPSPSASNSLPHAQGLMQQPLLQHGGGAGGGGGGGGGGHGGGGGGG